MILVVDNYDSFAHNLARYFRRLGQDVAVRRNDALSLSDIEQPLPDAIVISPGPCTPREAGISLDLVRQFAGMVPILGVCLGHQVIAEAVGGRVVVSGQPVHGRTSPVWHDGSGLFDGIPNPLVACRYHSLVVQADSLPAEIEITARTEDNVVMAIAHRHRLLWGVQFHPESVLTEHGYQLLGNFLALAGRRPSVLPSRLGELSSPARPRRQVPDVPVTF